MTFTALFDRAEYGALMVMEQKYGQEANHEFLKYELDQYLRGRAGESKFEKTLLDNDNQQYVWYQKGGLVLYALQDYIGDKRLNAGFAEMLKDFAFKPAPYATTADWYGYIKSVTPDSMRYFLEDSFEKITLYENRAKEATSVKRADGRYDVTLTFDSDKIYYDGNGKELARGAQANLLEIGVFASDTTNAAGMIARNPLLVEKRWVKPGKDQKITITVEREPLTAGIDPYNKMIDRVRDDNLVGI